MLKILQTGDVMLDSPVFGLTEQQAEARRAETLETFVNMLSYAAAHEVDLILIAGDLYDAETVTPETVRRLNDAFAKVAIPVVAAPGEHDPYTENSLWALGAFPANVHVFKSGEVSSFTFDDPAAVVYGYAFTGATKTDDPLDGHTADADDRVRLLVGAGELGVADSQACPLSRPTLGAFGAEYAALGHRRNGSDFERCRNTVFAYAGCPEGHAFDEVGAKGAILAEIDKDASGTRFRTKRIAFSKRHAEAETIDCSGAVKQADVVALVEQRITEKGYGADTLLRVTLSGATNVLPDAEAVAAACGTLFAVSVEDRTVPAVRETEYERDPTVRGNLCREMGERMKGGNEQDRRVAALALRYGLEALSGETAQAEQGGEA